LSYAVLHPATSSWQSTTCFPKGLDPDSCFNTFCKKIKKNDLHTYVQQPCKFEVNRARPFSSYAVVDENHSGA